MSPGAIAFTAIIVGGIEGLALIGAAVWLIDRKKILLAATPRPQQEKNTAGQQPVPVTGGQGS